MFARSFRDIAVRKPSLNVDPNVVLVAVTYENVRCGSGTYATDVLRTPDQLSDFRHRIPANI
jgi:hypothetical protein